jgi:ABC-type transport system involved in cytochrome bd biosynthesis fused ATPase/permease subunit
MVHHYSQRRVETLVGTIITFVVFILLITPVVAMYRLTAIGKRDSSIHAVGVLIVFTLLFSAAVSPLTKVQRFDLFAASAAYCAFLVVFMSNFGNCAAG